MNRLQPSGPSTCLPAACATACASPGFARGDVVKGEPNCGNVAVDGVDGVAASCEVSASAPGPGKRLIKSQHELRRCLE